MSEGLADVPGLSIAVTTPSGNVGSHVVSMLLRAGIRPRVLSRRPEHLDPGVAASADVVEVDQRDVRRVARATEGVDALFWVDPTTGSEDPLADHGRATAAVVAAVEQNRIPRVVFRSSIGAELRHGPGEIDGLAATEVELDATDASVAHLRCGFFFTDLLLQLEAVRAGAVTVVLPPEQPRTAESTTPTELGGWAYDVLRPLLRT